MGVVHCGDCLRKPPGFGDPDRISRTRCPRYGYRSAQTANLRDNPKRTIRFFPSGNPRNFRPAMRFVRSAGGRVRCFILPIFASAGRPIKTPVAFRLKCPVSQNTHLKEKSWSKLAPFPLELSGCDPGREALRRRNDPLGPYVRLLPPFGIGGLFRIGIGVPVRLPPLDLGHNIGQHPEPAPGPLVPGAQPDLSWEP